VSLPAFEIHTPRSLQEASDLLERHGDDAILYSGGTELLLLLKLGLADYGHLVDVKGIEELRRLEIAGGALSIGAAITHRELEASTLVRAEWPALAEMERDVANIRVRTSGTLGGNLCFSDPHSDPATFLLAADAGVVCCRGAVPRTLPLRDFVRGPFETALGPGELLVSVRVPRTPEGAAMAHRKLAFHERPAATVSCLARLERSRVAEARVAVGSVGLVPIRAAGAERLLTDIEVGDDGALDQAGEEAAAEADPIEDANGSIEYKRNLVRVLVKRCFADAVERAGMVASE
jgi:aerobic carbon-monoxide dehydrogenase medium subunit